MSNHSQVARIRYGALALLIAAVVVSPLAFTRTSAQDIGPAAGAARALESLSVQSVIRGGGQGRVRVCLDGPAPAGGVTLLVKTNRPSVVPSPGEVLVPAGESCLRLTVDARAVASDVPVNVIARFGAQQIVRATVVRSFSGPPPATATATTVVTSTATATATSTATSTATATSTPTAIPSATATSTPTATPVPVLDFSFTVLSGVPVASGGTVTFEVCLVSSPSTPVVVVFDSSAMLRATAAPAGTTFATIGECQEATLTDIVDPPGTTSGQVRLQVRVGAFVDESENVSFPGTAVVPV